MRLTSRDFDDPEKACQEKSMPSPLWPFYTEVTAESVSDCNQASSRRGHRWIPEPGADFSTALSGGNGGRGCNRRQDQDLRIEGWEMTRSVRWDCDSNAHRVPDICPCNVGNDQISQVGLRLLHEDQE